MTVSVVIVNWNSKDLLRKCLISINATCAELSSQIIVVDGGSFDGCAEMLATDFPGVHFVQSNDNIGFGRANNLGLARVTREFVWVLNPDTEIHSGALQTLLGELKRLPDAGIVSPRFLNTDGTLQGGVHALPRPIRQSMDSEFLRRLLWPLGLWAPPNNFAPSATMPVEAVAGTAMLMRTTTMRRIGGFTPAYFMYAEDMDLCFKMRRDGHRIYHVPAAVVTHHGGASSSVQSSTFSAVMTCDALHLYMLSNLGLRSALTYRVATGIAATGRLLALLPRTFLGDTQRRALGKAAFRRWLAILSWSCGGQRWTKRFSSPGETAGGVT